MDELWRSRGLGPLEIDDISGGGIVNMTLRAAVLDRPPPSAPLVVGAAEQPTKLPILTSAAVRDYGASMLHTPVRIARDARGHFDVKHTGETVLAEVFGHVAGQHTAKVDGERYWFLHLAYYGTQNPVFTHWIAENRERIGGSVEWFSAYDEDEQYRYVRAFRGHGVALMEQDAAAYGRFTQLLVAQATAELPLAAADTPFDPEAARRRLLAAATEAGRLVPERAAAGFAAVVGDPAEPDSYRLPLADIVEGELRVVPQAVERGLTAIHNEAAAWDAPTRSAACAVLEAQRARLGSRGVAPAATSEHEGEGFMDEALLGRLQDQLSGKDRELGELRATLTQMQSERDGAREEQRTLLASQAELCGRHGARDLEGLVAGFEQAHREVAAERDALQGQLTARGEELAAAQRRVEELDGRVIESQAEALLAQRGDLAADQREKVRAALVNGLRAGLPSDQVQMLFSAAPATLAEPPAGGVVAEAGDGANRVGAVLKRANDLFRQGRFLTVAQKQASVREATRVLDGGGDVATALAKLESLAG